MISIRFSIDFRCILVKAEKYSNELIIEGKYTISG